MDVLLGETMGLHLAINWLRKLGALRMYVIFEMYAKFVVDAFNSRNVALSEFGLLVSVCKTLFLFFNSNSHI